MVWKAQVEENGFSDPGRCQGTPGAQKRVRAGALQCFDGILNPFLMGRGSPGRDWCWGTPGYPHLAGPSPKLLFRVGRPPREVGG